MQQLHLVGFTTDLEGLIFSARRGAKSGGFVLSLDDRLIEMLEEALRLRGERDGDDAEDAPAGEVRADPRSPRHPSKGRAAEAPAPRRAPRPESHLTPREIQSRLRAGRTIEEVAGEAGVDDEWIARFAAPIQAEQRQVVGRARELTFSKARLGESTQPLGTSVLWNLADRGVALTEDEYETGWSAYHLRDTSWVVRFEYESRRRTQTAEWEVDLRDGELFSLNRLASDLGYVERGRRKRRIAFAEPPPELPPPPPEPTPPPASGSSPASRRPAEKRRSATPSKKAASTKSKKAPAKKSRATKKATPKRTAAKVATRKATAKKKAPARKAVAKRAAAKKKAPAKRSQVSRQSRSPRRPASRARKSPAKRGAARATTKRATAKKSSAKKASKRPGPATSVPNRPVGFVTTAVPRAPSPPVAAPPRIATRVEPTAIPARRPSVVPLATSDAPPPGGRRPAPPPPTRHLEPPRPAADLVTAGEDEGYEPDRDPAVRIIPPPAAAEPSSVPSVVRIDTRSPAVVASVGGTTKDSEPQRARTRVRPVRVDRQEYSDPSPQPLRRDTGASNGSPAVRIWAERAADGAPEVRGSAEGRRRRRPLRAR